MVTTRESDPPADSPLADVDRRAISSAATTVLALSAVVAVTLAGVAVHELQYASGHPFAYGPAKVIALTAGAGAVLAVAVGVLARALLRAVR